MPAHAAAQQPVGQQRADLVAGQLPAAADHGAAVGVRVLGDRDVGAHRAAASACSRSVAPGSSGLGKATVGNARIGPVLLRHAVRLGQPGGGEHRAGGVGAHAVHRGVGDGQRRALRPGRPASGCTARHDGGDVVGLDVVAEGHPLVAARQRAGRARPRAIAASISRSAGGTSWRAVAEVDLVAVVLGRVVAGGHHDRRPRSRGAGRRRPAPASAAAAAAPARRTRRRPAPRRRCRANSSERRRAS